MFKKLCKIIWPNFWWQTLLIVFMLLTNGLLSSLSVLSILPFLNEIDRGDDADGKIITLFKYFFSLFNIEISAVAILSFVSLIIILKSLIEVINTYFFESLRLKIEADHKDKLYKSVLNVRVDFLNKNNFGKLTNLIVLETRFIGMLINHLSRFLTSSVEFLVFSFLIFFISFELTLGSTLIVLLFYFFFRRVYLKANLLGAEVTRLNSEIQAHTNYTLSGYRVLKTLSGENRFLIFFENLIKIFKLKNLRLSLIEQIMNSMFEPLVIITVLIAFIILSPSIPTLIIFIAALTKMYSSLKIVQNQYFKLMKHLPSLDVFTNALKDLNENQYDNNERKKPFTGFKNKIIFKNVEYSYTIFDKNFKLGPIKNLEINRGETIALVGPSGAGKSTLVDLLEGFIFPQKGSIKIDGLDIKEINFLQYRNKIGYVSQDTFFLNDTIKNNITFGNDEIQERDVKAALKDADAIRFINELPDGVDTIIGEQGSRLSGGQKQRISLARALVKNPEVLILDEATSALDNETERRVWDTIEKLKGQITVIIIAHKLSFISKVDKIFVIENGKILENGTFQNLMNKKGRFFQFYRSD